MSKLTERYQILVIAVFLFLETGLEGVAEPQDIFPEKKYNEDEVDHQEIRTKIPTRRNESFEGNDDNNFLKIKKFNKKQVILSRSKYSTFLKSKFKLKSREHFKRSIRPLKSTNVSIAQSEQLCGGLEIQLPCTCYHPDHPNVTRIELDTDEITKNESSLNGTGPASCEDILSMGYKIPGFYLVRFKPKRVKAIYCNFNQTLQNLSNESEISKIFFRNRDASEPSDMVQFCNSLRSQLCKFFYSDYPDAPPFHQKKTKTGNNNIISSENYTLEPRNCLDLKIMGHRLRGFYVARLNALRVKIMFCDFNRIIETVKEERKKRFTLKKDERPSPKNITRVCEGIGSQPCSCYSTYYPEVLQFELSNDEITREAIHENGTAPSTCEELKQVGHNVNGFYFLRINSKTIKTAYCTFKNETGQYAKNIDENELSTSVQLKLASREMRTETSSNNEKKQQNCEPNNDVMHLKKDLKSDYDYSLNVTNESISTQKYVLRPQFCGGFGAQPCTCYYPDHPNVTLFELDTSEITRNAISVNGTGPTSCEDLHSIGHNLEGFYMVRFKPNRVKAIFCGFKQTLENFSNKSQVVTKSFLKEIRDPGSSEIIRFCNGLGNQPCTFLYTDHPDVPFLHLRRNKTSNTDSSCENCILGPTSCNDLRLIGHKFKGFYIIRQNALKVKIIYCDFDKMNSNADELIRKKPSTLKKNVIKSSRNVTRVCRDVGSQPCSCYYSNNRDILQFEMSNDEITRSAMDTNGTGPATCEELKSIGHNYNGFYMLRYNITTIKTVYCNLKVLERKTKKKKKEKNELNIIEATSTLFEIKTSTPTMMIKKKKKEKHQISTIEPTEATQDFETSTHIMSATTKKRRPKCNPIFKIYHVKNEALPGFCIEMTTQKSLSLSECDNFPLEQQWGYFKTPSSPGYTISIASGTSCITVIPPPWFSGRKPEISIKEFDDSGKYLHQQWILDDETSQLRNIATKLCLAVYSISLENPSSTGDNWKFEMNPCLLKPNKAQKWSFVRVRDNNNVTLCAHGGLN